MTTKAPLVHFEEDTTKAPSLREFRSEGLDGALFFASVKQAESAVFL